MIIRYQASLCGIKIAIFINAMLARFFCCIIPIFCISFPKLKTIKSRCVYYFLLFFSFMIWEFNSESHLEFAIDFFSLRTMLGLADRLGTYTSLENKFLKKVYCVSRIFTCFQLNFIPFFLY